MDVIEWNKVHAVVVYVVNLEITFNSHCTEDLAYNFSTNTPKIASSVRSLI